MRITPPRIAWAACALAVACVELEPATSTASLDTPPPPSVDEAWAGGEVSGLSRPPPDQGLFESPVLPPLGDRIQIYDAAEIVARVQIERLDGEAGYNAPASVDWPGNSVVTLARGRVLRPLCGTARTGDILSFRYLGGKAPSGESMATTRAPRLEEGRVYVVVLDEQDGAYFVSRGALGAFDDANGNLRSHAGDQSNESEASEWCQ